MKRMLLFALTLTLLTGCAAAAPTEAFYVTDETPELEDPAFSIFFGVPVDATASETADRRTVYTAEDGRYRIESAVLPGYAAEQAMQTLTGLTKDVLRPVQTTRLGMKDYRFSWCREDEDGLELCTGAVLEDENCCYCLVFSAPEDTAGACRDVQTQVMDSFSLFEDEGF